MTARDVESTKRARNREGRDALLDATVRVVAKHGLRGLTYRRVANEAGTTHGLVSYHFGSREALIQEAAAKASREAITGSSLDPPSRLIEEFVQYLPELSQSEADAQAFQFELALEARRNSGLLPEVRAAYEEWFAVTQRALAAFGLDADSDATARLVFAAIDGLTMQQLIFGDPVKTREAVVLLQAVLRRMGAEDAPQVTRGASTA